MLATGFQTLADPLIFGELVHAYPRSIVVGCGRNSIVEPHALAVTVSQFERTELHLCSIDVRGGAFTAGREAASKLAARPGLRGIVAFAHGVSEIGELRRGLASLFDENVVVSCDDAPASWLAIGRELRQSAVAAIGFYGDHIVLGADGRGTWDRTGPALSESSLPRKREAAAHAALLSNPRTRTLVIPPAPGRIARPSQPAIVIPPIPASGSVSPSIGSAPIATPPSSSTIAGGTPAEPTPTTAAVNATVRASSLAQRPSVPSIPTPPQVTRSPDATRPPLSTLASPSPLPRPPSPVALHAPPHAAVDSSQPDAWDFDAPDLDESGPAGAVALDPPPAGAVALHPSPAGAVALDPSPAGVVALHPSPARPNAAATRSLSASSFNSPSTSAGYRSTVADSIASYASIADTHDRDTKLGTATELHRAESSRPSFGADDDPDPLGAALAESAAAVAAGRPSQVFGAQRPIASRAVVVRMPKSIGADAVIETAVQDGVQTVSIRGRIAETFRGAPIGQSFDSTVIVDVADVDRITSYGVREWMAMLGGAPTGAHVYLARCSEPIANQLALIRGFSGSARITSCFAPYLCSSCGAELERLVDCELDAYEVRAGALVPVPCPRCSAEARFDDDVSVYFAFLQSHLGEPIPTDVRAVLERAVAPVVVAPAADAFEKTVDAGGTRIRVHGDLTGQLRWRRVVDGLDGRVVIDLAELTGSDAAGAANLEQAIRATPAEAAPIEIEHAPPSVVAKLALQEGPRRATVTSAIVTGYCATCAVHRPASLVLAQVAADRDASRTHAIRCRRCNEVLALSVDPSLDRLVSLQHRSRRFSAPPTTVPVLASPIAAPTSNKRVPILIIAILLAVAAGVFVLVKLVASDAPTPPRHSTRETLEPRSPNLSVPHRSVAPSDA
ncbi:MAG TPA: hypothetical protein VGM88_12360 [Kofleriaceae bacterium]